MNKDIEVGTESRKFELQEVYEERKFEFDIYLIIGGMIILFLELLYIKLRGDI